MANLRSKSEKLEAVKTALRAIGPIEPSDSDEMELMREICKCLTELRLLIGKERDDVRN